MILSCNQWKRVHWDALLKKCSAEFVVALILCLCITVWKGERLSQRILTFSSRSVSVFVRRLSQTVQADKCLCWLQMRWSVYWHREHQLHVRLHLHSSLHLVWASLDGLYPGVLSGEALRCLICLIMQFVGLLEVFSSDQFFPLDGSVSVLSRGFFPVPHNCCLQCTSNSFKQCSQKQLHKWVRYSWRPISNMCQL